MQTTNLQVKNSNLNSRYSVIIGKNVFKQIPIRLKIICPSAKKIALVVDKKIPINFRNKL